MKKIALYLLFTLVALNVFAQESPEEIAYNEIVETVILEEGYYDFQRIENEFSQWMMSLPVPESDAELLDNGICNPCEPEGGQDSQFKQPGKITINAKQSPNGSYPTTFKVSWKKPKPLQGNSPYSLSHYNVYLAKDNQSYEIFKVTSKRKNSNVKNSISFHNKQAADYSIRVQAVYETTAESKSITAKLQKPIKGNSESLLGSLDLKAETTTDSPYTAEVGVVILPVELTVGDLTGNLKNCVENSGYTSEQLYLDITTINCTDMVLNNNDIVEMSNFSNLRNVTFNQIRQVTDISPLAILTSISLLNISESSQIDVSDLTAFTGLSNLYLTDMGLTEVPNLSTLTGMWWLNLSNNQISGSLENLPDWMPYVFLQNNNINSCDGIGEKDVFAFIVGGDYLANLSTLSNCPNKPQFTLAIFDSFNMDPVQSINDFSGINALYFNNSHFERLVGSRPINQITLNNNPKLKSIDIVKPAETTGVNNYPNLVPQNINLTGSNNMSCSQLYSTQAMYVSLDNTAIIGPLTTIVEGIEKTWNSTNYGGSKNFIMPTNCSPDTVQDFEAVKDAASYDYYLSWSKQDHDIWGVSYYEVIINGTDQRTIPFDFQLPLLVNVVDANLARFEVRACTQTETADPLNPLVTCGEWNSTNTTIGLDKVSNLRYVWRNQPEGLFKLKFDYIPSSGSTFTNTPDFFMVSPGPLQVVETAIPSVPYKNGKTSYNSEKIDKDNFFGNTYSVRACKNLTNGEVICGQGSRVTLDVTIPSEINIATPVVTTPTNMTTTTGELTIDFSHISAQEIDYFRIIENQPTPVINGPPTNIPALSPIFGIANLNEYTVKPDGTNSASLNLIRRVNGDYTFSISACIKSDGGDSCSQTPLELTAKVTRTIKNQSDLSHVSGAPAVDPNLYGMYLYKQACNINGNYDNSYDCTTYDLNTWFYPSIYYSSNEYYNKRGLEWYYKDNNNSTKPDYFYFSKINQTNGGKNQNLGVTPKYSRYDVLTGNACVNKTKDLLNENPNNEVQTYYAKQSIVIPAANHINNSQNRWRTDQFCSGGIRVSTDGMWKIQACYDGIGCTNGKVVDMSGPNGSKSLVANGNQKFEKVEDIVTTKAVEGPRNLQPGLWWNPHQAGTGWYFYWKNNSSNPDKQLDHSYDLLAYWVTYRSINGIWSPVWMHSTMTLQQADADGNQYFAGQMKYTNIINDIKIDHGIGTIKVILNQNYSLNNKAKVELDIDEGFGLMTSYDQVDTDDADVGSEYRITYNTNLVNGINRIDSLVIPLEIASLRLVNDADITRFGNEHDGDHFQGVWEHREVNDP
ncbi:MAG: hypothetical protein L3J83_07905, partial [Proteobacteria bacterium]|nr:hypothetical protein [Pseudomonadota bacterium]